MTTDRDAVERLACALEDTATVHDAMKRAFMSLECTTAAANLRALLADRDHADAQLQAAVEAMREAAAKVAQDKHDAAVKWASHHLRNFDGQTDSLLIAKEIRALPAPTDALERALEAAVLAEREACAKLADAYADENRQMAADTIIIDPVLAAMRKGKARDLTPADFAVSEQRQVDGAIHSSMFHASQNIAAAIRARSDKGVA